MIADDGYKLGLCHGSYATFEMAATLAEYTNTAAGRALAESYRKLGADQKRQAEEILARMPK